MQYVVRYSYEVGTSTFEGKESVPQWYRVKGRVVMRPVIDLNEGDEVAVFVSANNAKKATIAPGSWETGTGPLLFISGIATIALLILSLRAL